MALACQNFRRVDDDAAVFGNRYRMQTQRADVHQMTRELPHPVISRAMYRAKESPVFFFPLDLTIAVRAPARSGHKTILDAQQKKHPLGKRSHRPDLKIVDLAAVYFTGA